MNQFTTDTTQTVRLTKDQKHLRWFLNLEKYYSKGFLKKPQQQQQHAWELVRNADSQATSQTC